MDFLTLAEKRCTTRGFTGEKIPDTDLERILSAGPHASSLSAVTGEMSLYVHTT